MLGKDWTRLDGPIRDICTGNVADMASLNGWSGGGAQLVFVTAAFAVIDAVDRLRDGVRFGGRQPIRGGSRLSTWRRPRSPTPALLQRH
jgi:hypothetical protein